MEKSKDTHFQFDRRPLKYRIGDAAGGIIIDPPKVEDQFFINPQVCPPIYTVGKNQFMKRWHERTFMINAHRDHPEQWMNWIRASSRVKWKLFSAWVKDRENLEFIEECKEFGF